LAPEAIERQFAELEAQGRASLLEEGVPAEQLAAEYSVDLRYRGQSYTLNVPWRGVAQASEAFAARHEARYGHRMEVAVELVNLRVVIAGSAASPRLAESDRGRAAEPVSEASLFGLVQRVPVYDRATLAQGQRFRGPALVTETVATTWLETDWECRVDRFGNLLLRLRGSV
jgi:N-methylhydantoinase A